MDKYISIIEIANAINGIVVGNKELKITGLAICREAKLGDISYALRESDVLNCDASAFITRPLLIKGDTEKTFIYISCEMDEVLSVLTDLFIQHKIIQRNVNHFNLGIDSTVKIGEGATIGDQCNIGAYTVLGKGVTIGKGCNISSNVYIGEDVRIGNKVTIESGARIGNMSFQFTSEKFKLHKRITNIGAVIIGDDVSIGANSTIDRGTIGNTIIGEGTVIDNLVHIGHEVVIGKTCKIAAMTAIAGRATIGDYTIIYGQVGITNDVKIGNHVIIMAKSGVMSHIKDYEIVSGHYAHNHQNEMRLQAMIRRIYQKMKGRNI